MRAVTRTSDFDAGAARRRGGATLDALLIGPVLMGLAAFLHYGPNLLDLPESGGRAVHASRIDTSPRRVAMSDPPRILINGFERNCMDCHQIFPATEIAPKHLQQHTHIVLDHGINDRCRNCHDVQDRDRLVMRNGETIGYDEVPLLCAGCHGPTYRDWQVGAHGRINGYWDAELGELKRLKCTQCHDPHDPRRPAMDPVRPLPGPHTLRMGTDVPEAEHDSVHDPLRDALHRMIETESNR